MNQSVTTTIDRAVPIDALGLRRTAAGLGHLAKIQGLERTIAILRAENLAARVHVQEFERVALEPAEDRGGAGDNGHPA